MFLLDDIALLPIRGLAWVFGELYRHAEEEYYNPESLKATLAELEVLKRSGEVGPDEYQARASELFERLAEAVKRRAAARAETADRGAGRVRR